MDGFEKNQIDNKVVNQNNWAKIAQKQKILHQVLQKNNYEEQQKKEKILQEQKIEEQEFISSTNNLESFKEVMEKICSKNASKQGPHLQFNQMNSFKNLQCDSSNIQNGISPNIFKKQDNPSQLKFGTQMIKKIDKQEQNSVQEQNQNGGQNVAFKTQVIPSSRKLFDFNQFANNSKKGKLINENQSDKQSHEIPQPVQKEQSEFHNIIGKKLFKKEDWTQSEFGKSQKLMEQPQFEACEEEKLESDFGRNDFDSRFQTQNFEPNQQNSVQSNINQSLLKKPTITELFFMDQQNEKNKVNKDTNDFEFENDELSMDLIQPISKQKTFMKVDQSEQIKQIQPRITPIQISDVNLQTFQKNQEIVKNEIQSSLIQIEKLEQKSMAIIESEFSQSLENIPIPLFGKNQKKVLLVDELDLANNIANMQNQQLISQKINQTQEINPGVLTVDQTETIENQSISLQIIHGKCFEEQKEEIETKKPVLKTQDIKAQIKHLGDDMLEDFKMTFNQRKSSLSQYCEKRQMMESDFYRLTPQEIEQESDDQNKSQEELHQLTNLNKTIMRISEQNQETQDTNDTNVSQSEFQSVNNGNQLHFGSSSRSNIQRISNISGNDNSRAQNEEVMEGLGGMSHFDAINQREEIHGEAATVQNEASNENISNFELELIHQNSSNFEIDNIQSASRRRINSFNRNDQLFARASNINKDIEIQMLENLPQPLRRQNAYIERQQSSQFRNQNGLQNFFEQATFMPANTEEQVANALREAFLANENDIDEQMLTMQQPSLQLTRGGISRAVVPSIIQEPEIFENIQSQQTLPVQENENQSIAQLFIQQFDDLHQRNTQLLDQNQDLLLENQYNLELLGFSNFERQNETAPVDEAYLNPFERYDLERAQESQRRVIQEQEQILLSQETNIEKEEQQFEIQMENIRHTAQFENAHPKWIDEIQDAMNLKIFQSSKDIVENLGALSLLIFTRLFIINETYEIELENLEKNKKKNQSSEKIWTENLINSFEQMSFNNQYQKKGVPCMTQSFLIHLAQRMINIAHFESNKNSFIFNKIQNDQSQEQHFWKSFQEIKDKVFPPIEELYYCVKNKLINKKETILYKMLIDFNEALFIRNEPTSEQKFEIQEKDLKKINDVIIPCTIKFYEHMNEVELNGLLMKIEELNTNIYSKIEIENKIEKMKKQMQATGAADSQYKQALSRFPLNILQTQNIFANFNQTFNDEITQIVLNPVQYFLKEAPLSNSCLGSQIFSLRKLSDQDCNKYQGKKEAYSSKKGEGENRGFVVLREREEFISYFKNMQINLRNQSFKPLASARKDNKRDLQHLLSPKSKKSSRNVCKVNESVECYQDRKEAGKNAANKKKMSWNKKKNVLMHNGSYFLKNVLV